MKRFIRRIKKRVYAYLLEFFQKDDAPIRLAIGFAIGVCVNFLPTFGFGFPLAIALSFITRTSIIGSLIGETLSKVFFPIFLLLDVFTGNLLCPFPNTMYTPDSVMAIFSGWKSFQPYAVPLLIGMSVNILLAGSLITFINYWLLSRYRKKIIKFLLSREEEIC
ncbi:MAG: DUF2062 domain-containing protein [Chitinophagales bacterium]